MTFDQHLPGYRGQIKDNAVTIAEVLKDAGYNTGMVGKWHVSETQLRDDQHLIGWTIRWNTLILQISTLTQLIVDFMIIMESFTALPIISTHSVWSMGETPVKTVPNDFYITDAFSDTAIKHVSKYAKDTKPLFHISGLYSTSLATSRLARSIKKYENVYKAGWDSIRNATLRKGWKSSNCLAIAMIFCRHVSLKR